MPEKEKSDQQKKQEVVYTEASRLKEVTSKNKQGIYIDPTEALQNLMNAYPWFRIEAGRDDFIRVGNAYAHPHAAIGMSLDTAANTAKRTNIHTSVEELKAIRDTTSAYNKREWEDVNAKHPEWEEFGYWEEYFDIPGCVEEPDAPKLHVLMRRLRDNYKKGPYPIVLVIPTGALFFNDPWLFSNAPVTKFLGVQTIIPEFRSFVDAPYPAAINDIHATYQWMVENAEKLNIDLDRIIIWGGSSGGHLASAFSFRLKRYDWCGAPMPRGIVVEDGFFDDRETRRSMRVLSNHWCGLSNRGANMLYMGDNFASGFIGPEGYANHATIEECRGLPPFLILEGQDNPGCDHAMEFILKLNEVGVYCSYFMQGGAVHAARVRDDGIAVMPFMNINMQSEYKPRTGYDASALMEQITIGGIIDFLDNDFRRQFNK